MFVSETDTGLGREHNQSRRRVAELRGQGHGTLEIARRLGLSKSTVAYHLRKLGQPPDARFLRRYDWAAVQQFHDDGHSARECRKRFGFSTETWHAAVRRGDLVPRLRAMPVEELLSGPRSRGHLKQRLFGLGLKSAQCERCGIADWRGRPLGMALHHINGDGADNRLENLQILCPNCHSQTENFAGRNRRREASGADTAVGASEPPEGADAMNGSAGAE